MYGSVRGTVGNDRSYRDSLIGSLGCCSVDCEFGS